MQQVELPAAQHLLKSLFYCKVKIIYNYGLWPCQSCHGGGGRESSHYLTQEHKKDLHCQPLQFSPVVLYNVRVYRCHRYGPAFSRLSRLSLRKRAISSWWNSWVSRLSRLNLGLKKWHQPVLQGVSPLYAAREEALRKLVYWPGSPQGRFEWWRMLEFESAAHRLVAGTAFPLQLPTQCKSFLSLIDKQAWQVADQGCASSILAPVEATAVVVRGGEKLQFPCRTYRTLRPISWT